MTARHFPLIVSHPCQGFQLVRVSPGRSVGAWDQIQRLRFRGFTVGTSRLLATEFRAESKTRHPKHPGHHLSKARAAPETRSMKAFSLQLCKAAGARCSEPLQILILGLTVVDSIFGLGGLHGLKLAETYR